MVERMAQESKLENVRGFYDGISQEYDARFQGKIARFENAAIFGDIASNMALGTTLDVGCGTGLFLEHILPHPTYYLGVDISSGMLTEAMRRYPDYKFKNEDAQGLMLHGDTFKNVISLFGGLSFCEDIPKAIKECYRVLDVGGFFFLMFYASAYRYRKSHIAFDKEALFDCLAWSQAFNHLKDAGITDMKIIGFNNVRDDEAEGMGWNEWYPKAWAGNDPYFFIIKGFKKYA